MVIKRKLFTFIIVTFFLIKINANLFAIETQPDDENQNPGIWNDLKDGFEYSIRFLSYGNFRKYTNTSHKRTDKN